MRPRALDYLEGQLPAAGFLFGEIGLADIAIASFFRNADYAGFTIDAGRWPSDRALRRARCWPIRCWPSCWSSRTSSASVDIKGRRQALLDAGAPLTDATLGIREPRRGMMRL